MKRLIICFDGTWNNPEQEENGVTSATNVYRLKNYLGYLYCFANDAWSFYEDNQGYIELTITRVK